MSLRPRRRVLLQYGVLALPLAFAGLPVYVHAPDFYARELQLSLVSIGLVLLGLRLVDALQDPLIGSISDRFAHRRRLIIQLGAVLLAGGFWMIFHPLQSAPLAWFTASIFLCTTGFSIVSINLNTLGGLWRVLPEQRTRVTGWREAFGLCGLLAAAALPGFLGSTERPAAAFHQLSLVFLLLLVPCLLLFFRWLQNAEQFRQDTVPARRWGSLALLFSGNWERHFFAIYLLSAAASALPAVLVIFFIRDRLEAEALTGGFLAIYFLSGALGMPLWQRLAGRIGKDLCWVISMALAIQVFIWAFTLERGDTGLYALICMFSGFALGADLALPPALLADRLAERGVQAHASSYFALLSFLTKSALVLATGISLPLLGALGYQPGQVEDYAITRYLSVAYALVPCAMKAIALMWLWWISNPPRMGGAGTFPAAGTPASTEYRV